MKKFLITVAMLLALPVPTNAQLSDSRDRSKLMAQAPKGTTRITVTGHTDTSGPETYNMALSLRRANAVKQALVREGVPATAITVLGKGEAQLLVPTGDNVREPQNRRVEIVIK